MFYLNSLIPIAQCSKSQCLKKQSIMNLVKTWLYNPRQADRILLASPLSLDYLWLQLFYTECLNQPHRLMPDLLGVLKIEDNLPFLESLFIDEIKSHLEDTVLREERVLRRRVLKELNLLIPYLYQEFKRFDLYEQGVLSFQSLSVFDDKTFELSRINPYDL